MSDYDIRTVDRPKYIVVERGTGNVGHLEMSKVAYVEDGYITATWDIVWDRVIE